MKKRFLFTAAAAAVAMAWGGGEINAQNGQPHSVKAEVNFSDVTLSWKKPADKITLQWHDDSDYNGMDGVLSSPEGTVVFYAASKFTADDLKNHAGMKVEYMKYFEYREVYQAYAMIYEDGNLVYEQAADLSGFEKNSWRSVKLAEAYTIPADKDVMFAIKYVYGRNMELTAICDREPQKGKGNLYSYDGKTWKSDGAGDFLITAELQNNATQEPDGYNIYRDGAKVNGSPINGETAYTLKGETDGTHSYKVSAIYGADEKMSDEVQATPLSVYSRMPGVSYFSGSADNLTGTLKWGEPLRRSTVMTWSRGTLGSAIGGTSSTAPKVWIIHRFSKSDMAAFPNHQIKAIRSYIKQDGTITGVTAFVMKDGKIDYSEEVSENDVTAITYDSWNQFMLKTPYKMELGSEYAVGLYYTHSKKGHPVGVDDTEAIDSKGNSFSTSSPSSKGFNESKPSWKTLSSGKIPGNFMIEAEVEALSTEASQPQTVTGYDIYRDGVSIAENVTKTTYTDNVSDLGTYTYSIIAKGPEGKSSPAVTADITYTLPEEYTAPIILDREQNGKDFNLTWSSAAYDMRHYGTASYMAGFKEEMSILYGAKFTKEELAPYAGYQFYSIKFGIGEALDAFKLKIITSDSEVLYTKEFKKGDIDPGYIYTITFNEDEKVSIPEGKDVYLAYDATLPANTNPILLDNGPATAGGAVVNLTGGTGTWLNLGTISPTFADYNIVIGALAVKTGTENAASAKAKACGVALSSSAPGVERLKRITVEPAADINTADGEYGIEPLNAIKTAPEKSAEKPKAKSFKVYCNNRLVTETTEPAYSGTLNGYGLFNYNITTVYENGWESPASETVSFSNTIAQKSQAPYNLKGETDGKNLKLTWQTVGEAPELTYQTGTSDMVLGMTGSGTREGYHTIKFKAGEIADKVGQEVSHVRFKIADNNLLSAAVVVMYGYNVVYEQKVGVDEISVGWNTVRLNNPVPVVAGQDLSVGYHITYQSGISPIVCDEGPAVPGYGDLISSSGDPGYWYSLSEKYGQNYNYRISATLKTPDSKLKPAKIKKAAEDVTYNIYRNGTAVQTGVSATTFTLTDAAYGSYTVTAVTSEGESAESNSVEYNTATGITLPENSLSTDGDGTVYSIDGQAVSKNGDTGKLKKGVYIMNGKKFIVK